MATKSKKIVTKGKSLTYLTKKTAEWKSKVNADASRITKAKADKAAAQKETEKYDDYLAKTGGYNDTIGAYKDLEKQIAAQHRALLKTKKKATKKTINAKIKSLTKQKAQVNTKIQKLSTSKEYLKQLNNRYKANQKVKSANSRIKAAAASKKKKRSTYDTYRKALNKAKSDKKKATQKKNSALIQKKIHSKANRWYGHTAIYRADLMSSKVFMLSEHSPSESNDGEGPTSAVDKGDPRSNYFQRTAKTLSGTYYLWGTSFEDCDKQFRALETWQKNKYPVHIRGFSKWKKAYMTNVSKSMDTPYGNTMPLSISFEYIVEAPITQSKKKTKAKLVIVKKKGKRVVMVKNGKSLYEISKKTNIDLKLLKKLNPKKIKTPKEVKVALE